MSYRNAAGGSASTTRLSHTSGTDAAGTGSQPGGSARYHSASTVTPAPYDGASGSAGHDPADGDHVGVRPHRQVVHLHALVRCLHHVPGADVHRDMAGPGRGAVGADRDHAVAGLELLRG